MAKLASASLPYTPQPMRHGRLHGVWHPQLADFFRAILPVENLAYDDDTTIYKERPNLVREVHLPATLALPWVRMVVKSFGWRGPQHYLFSPLKRSKAMKSYDAACHLLAYGLGTPMPLGAFEARRYGFIQYNVYATEAITDYITLRDYCLALPDGVDGMHEVLQLAADYVRRMHDSGMWHRDMFLSNFLLTGSPGKRQLYLVDLNRSRRLPYMPVWLRAIDLARMEWRAWQPQFFVRYCAGRYSAERLTWILHLYGRWRTARRRVLRVINPLRRRLGLK